MVVHSPAAISLSTLAKISGLSSISSSMVSRGRDGSSHEPSFSCGGRLRCHSELCSCAARGSRAHAHQLIVDYGELSLELNDALGRVFLQLPGVFQDGLKHGVHCLI